MFLNAMRPHRECGQDLAFNPVFDTLLNNMHAFHCNWQMKMCKLLMGCLPFAKSMVGITICGKGF